jgi:hypothetical protein
MPEKISNEHLKKFIKLSLVFEPLPKLQLNSKFPVFQQIGQISKVRRREFKEQLRTKLVSVSPPSSILI